MFQHYSINSPVIFLVQQSMMSLHHFLFTGAPLLCLEGFAEAFIKTHFVQNISLLPSTQYTTSLRHVATVQIPSASVLFLLIGLSWLQLVCLEDTVIQPQLFAVWWRFCCLYCPSSGCHWCLRCGLDRHSKNYPASVSAVKF